MTKKKQFNAGEAWKRASDFYDNKKFDECLVELEAIVSNGDNPAFICYVRATVIDELGRTNDTLDELNRSLRFDPTLSVTNQAKAQFLYRTNGDLDEALSCINIALQNYSPDDLENSLGDASSLSAWIQGYVAARSDMVNLKTSIEGDLRSNLLYLQMQDIEKNVEQQLSDGRHRSFEMLGVFAAIIALVLATAQGATALKGVEFFWLGMGLVVPISFLVMLVSPRQDNRFKVMITITGIIFASGLVGYFIRGYTG